MHWVWYMKSSASKSKPFKGEIPGWARRKGTAEPFQLIEIGVPK